MDEDESSSSSRSRRFGKSLENPFGHPTVAMEFVSPTTTTTTATTFSNAFSEMHSKSIVAVSGSESQATRGRMTNLRFEQMMVDSNTSQYHTWVDQSQVSPLVNKPPLYPYQEMGITIPELREAIEKELIKNGPTSDPIKLKRIVSNRLWVQKCRRKKVEYLGGLLKKAKDLETFVANLNSEIELYTRKQESLLGENAALKQHVHDFMAISNLRQIENKVNKQEVERLNDELIKKQSKEEMMQEENSSMGILLIQQQDVNIQGSPSFRHPYYQHQSAPAGAGTSSGHQFEGLNYEMDVKNAEMVDEELYQTFMP